MIRMMKRFILMIITIAIMSGCFSGMEVSASEVQNDSYEVTLNYLYVESPYLVTPAKQNVAISLGDGTENLSEVTLVSQKSSGETQVWDIAKQEDNLFLFTGDFSESDSGTYEFIAVEYLKDEEYYRLNLKEIGIEAGFGVNEEYISESSYVEEGIEVTPQDIEQSVVILDGDNIENADEIVEEKLENMAASVPMTLAIDESGAETIEGMAEEEELIVVLDPGHGGFDPGAIGINGVREADLTLKIARYAKEELETYQGVKVFMIRESDTSLTSATVTELKARADWAKEKGADVYVSIHLNASGGRGAEVYYPNPNYCDQETIYQPGKGLATEILKELTALGLQDRGIHERWTVEDIYPDGSKHDWYGVIRYSKLNGFPGVIIEHAFIDNYSDYVSYLCTDEKLKKLGVADATGIANAYGLSKTTTGEKTEENEKEDEVESSFNGSVFSDVSEADWYYNDVKNVYDNNIMTGMRSNYFGSNETLSRSQFAVVLYRMEGEPEVSGTNPFPDVANGTWYTDAIIWAKENGIVTGYAHNGHFGVADSITREQMATIMYRYAGYKGYDTSVKADFGRFIDASKVSGFAKEAMQWVVGNEIITGKYDAKYLAPLEKTSRAECAAIITRFMNTVQK